MLVEFRVTLPHKIFFSCHLLARKVAVPGRGHYLPAHSRHPNGRASSTGTNQRANHVSLSPSARLALVQGATELESPTSRSPLARTTGGPHGAGSFYLGWRRRQCPVE